MNTNKVSKHRVINIDYEKNKISWVYYIPLLLIAGFVPLIVYGKYIDLTGTTQALYWTGQNGNLDFFSYWKSRWVIFLTATALVIYIFLFISKKLPLKKEYKYYIPLAIYAFFVILSTIFAIDVPTALNGFMDMYQGMWVLLSYVLLTFLTINFVNSERDVKLFLYAFVFLIIVEGLLGLGQYFGFDIFNTKFGNNMVVPSGVNVDGGLNFNFGEHTIYGTLFNTNFVGSFATLMLPMAVVFLISAKTAKRRVVAGIALALCLFTWIGCNSRAGYIGVATSILVSFIMLRKYVLKYWKVSVSVVLIGIILLIGYNYVSDGSLVKRLSSMNVFKAIEDIKAQNSSENVFKFESINLGKDTVSIKTTYQDLNIKIDGDKLYFVDENDKILPMKTTEDGFLLVDDPSKVYLRVKTSDTYPGFNVTTHLGLHGSINFYILEEGIKFRGYIWGRTIPLLDKHLFIGAGADNFPIIFPQDDFIAKLNAGMATTTVVDKPHNMYLQIAINTGVMSLIALLTLWSFYLCSSIRLYWKTTFNSLDKCIGLACLFSVIGYLATGIFNDHIVSVAPLFWIILGLGISTNIRLKRKEKSDV